MVDATHGDDDKIKTVQKDRPFTPEVIAGLIVK